MDHYVCFASKIFIILELLGAEASKIKQLKDMIAVKIVCELSERAVRAPKDYSRYGRETISFLFRMEAFSRNFAAALTGLGECRVCRSVM